MTAGRIALFALRVGDCDAAIRFFTQALRFTLLEDTDQGGGKRGVVVAPPGGQGSAVRCCWRARPTNAGAPRWATSSVAGWGCSCTPAALPQPMPTC